MTDNRIYRTRSLGTPASGVKDQYADGTAAQLWELYIGDKNQRTDMYREFLIQQLRSNNCTSVLDVACGTGVDSIMLLEEGFQMTSIDLSDKMLKYALKMRWNRRKEEAFDAWEIEEANWMTLTDDLRGTALFDAVICMGNSFAHLPDETMDHSTHRVALGNFADMVKPGGLLIIDHRNYDYILKHGKAPGHNIYYNSKNVDCIITTLVVTEGKPVLVTIDHVMNFDRVDDAGDATDNIKFKNKRLQNLSSGTNNFRLSYYPHCVDDFSNLLKEAFGPGSVHNVFGDFKPIADVVDPAFFIHVIQKPK